MSRPMGEIPPPDIKSQIVWARKKRGDAYGWQLRKVVAVNPLGEPTHLCSLNSEETKNDSNSLEYLYIDKIEEIPEDHQNIITTLLSSSDTPIDAIDTLMSEDKKENWNKALSTIAAL